MDGPSIPKIGTKPISMMKKYIGLFLLASATGMNTQAQWTTDLSVNTTVRASSGNNAAVPLLADGPDGSTYTSWFESYNNDYQLRMQRLDADGNRLWPDSGLVVSAFPQNSAIFRYDLASDADGNAVVAFQDERTGTLDIVAYKIGPDGSFLWGADGVELPTPGTTGLAPNVSALSNGNSVVSWGTNNSPGTVAFQLIDPTGNLLLTVPTELSAATRLSRPVPVATSDGGFILQYELEGANFLAPATMYAQRFDAAGTAVWANPVVVSTKTIAGFYFPSPVSDGQDGFYLAFNTGNPNNPSFGDVYAQRVRSDGSLWSAQGTRMDNSDATQKFTFGKGLVRVNDADGLMVPMQVTDGAQGQSGVSVQRVDTAGAVQLGLAAIPVLAVSADYVQPWDISAVSDGELSAFGDGAVIVTSTGGFGQQTLAATRVDISGDPLWIPAQHDICTLNSNKDDLQTSTLRNGQVVAEWQDDRGLSGIYAQNITELDITTGIQPVETANGPVRLESNPTDRPVLLVDAAFGPEATVTVFDAQGKQVYGQAIATSTRMGLPLENMAPGIYTIRVRTKDQLATVRWVK